MDDISVFELNEAFASQVAYCVKTLGLPREKLNPNGKLHDVHALFYIPCWPLENAVCAGVGLEFQASHCFAMDRKAPRMVCHSGCCFAGGAIALGHPLGCTGARQVATLLPELRRRKARYGVVSMCVGTGMGAAAVIENLIR